MSAAQLWYFEEGEVDDLSSLDVFMFGLDRAPVSGLGLGDGQVENDIVHILRARINDADSEIEFVVAPNNPKYIGFDDCPKYFSAYWRSAVFLSLFDKSGNLFTCFKQKPVAILGS